ncbi:BREX-2 system adenine-specific DNA-methyltransferase PglX [Saccharothrix sp. HUAS TT1]|uniref:BREX-2 system adenine-specific DNA-methyltransferase PglX n=1 Tax=unclassified Saccharothrix TaxID=2593673 RepID=UPI00345C01E1
MLLKDLRKQVTVLEEDLRTRSDEEPFASALKTEYDEARKAERTAATYGAWRDERVTQVAVAWVLGTVFVRFCEDNGLIEWPFIAGPGNRLADAVERHEAFFKEHPEKNDRDWIVAAFDHLASSHKTVEGLFDKRYNPLWEITPSFEQATALLNFWRRRGDDGEIRYGFADDDWDTRFLGDLYQDLSEHARKTYALLQTPEFVEEFILDLTLEPAVDEFGLKGLRTIDPACGSGHFLLGIFHRLLAKWRVAEPGTSDWELISRSLESVHGCDKNPFAASIARFRLLVAALRAAGRPRLEKASIFPINVAVGDSLLHGHGAPGVQGSLFESENAYTYRTEDVAEYRSINLLGASSYHAVVGNPPYITPKDKQENENYRRGYDVCSGTYALSAPFAQRFFQLAKRSTGDSRNAGHVGQITANSFIRRKFGRKLVENFFPTVHLTRVIDTSSAFIPGHGTPTVILVGKNHYGRISDPIRLVHSLKGEPSEPEVPAEGAAWLAVSTLARHPLHKSEWALSRDADRLEFSKHPWPLTGGLSSEIAKAMESDSIPLENRVTSIGYTGQTNSDDSFLATLKSLERSKISPDFYRPFITGADIRDFTTQVHQVAIFPYSTAGELRKINEDTSLLRRMWPHRTLLGSRATFNGSTYREEDRAWWSWHQVARSRLSGPALTWSFVATHQHFAYLDDCMLHNRSAPLLKLPEDASRKSYLSLLGLLNSSAACFWLKQVSHDKGSQSGSGGFMHDEWERFYEFTGTGLQKFPAPLNLPVSTAEILHNLTQKLTEDVLPMKKSPSKLFRANLDARSAKKQDVRRKVIALQEELDWKVYESYGLLNRSEAGMVLSSNTEVVPEVNLGERAFEIVLARKVATEGGETVWFTRHGSTPFTEVPNHWPQWYQDIVQARIEIIEKRPDIALIERPEYKRRWATVPWEKREAEALRNWLVDRCEKPELWFALRDGMKHPRTLTVSQLADQFRDDADMNSVAQLYATDHLKKRDLTLAQVLEQVIADQHVPYLAALRYKDSGLRKREQWEEVWELQREEDRTGKRLDIPVPPKYGSGDFRKTSYWSQRGKLDVPKERFISYPDASPDADPTLLLGWAGWDHKDQAQALVNTVNDRTEQSGWSAERLTPLLAGLLEVLPWVKQWHGEYDDEWGGVPADEYDAYLTEQRAKHQLTEDDLRAWRPAAPTRGRRAAKKD